MLLTSFRGRDTDCWLAPIALLAVLLCGSAGCSGDDPGGNANSNENTNNSNVDVCTGVSCSGHGSCEGDTGTAVCNCDIGYHAVGLSCVLDNCTPTTHDSYACDAGDVYWYDSCGTREELKESCGGRGCTGDACVAMLLGVSPRLLNFRIVDVHKDRVYFDSSEIITASTVTGFSIGGGVALSGVTVNPGQTTDHYLTAAAPFTFWDNNTIRYAGGSDLADLDGNPLLEFTLTHIVNRIAEPEASTVRYVSATASGSGDGTSESTAWTTAQVNANAAAGMTIYYKAGTYSGVVITVGNSGSASAPIKHIGYKTVPGDISSLYYVYGVDTNLDPAQMPLFDGGDRDGSETFYDMGLFTSNYNIWKNMQFTGYMRVFRSASMTGFVGENILIKDVGDAADNGSGRGFTFQSQSRSANNIRLVGCTVINATHDAFASAGSNNLYLGCSAYCDEVDIANRAGLTTDYYFKMSGHDGIIKDCLAFRNTSTAIDTQGGHWGHGISIKPDYQTPSGGTAEHNLVDGNTVINCGWGIQARWEGVRYNVYKNNLSHADIPNRGVQSGGIQGFIVMGASDNIFENNVVRDMDFAVTIGFSTEDVAGVDAGNNNLFRNNVFYNLNPSFGYTIHFGGVSDSSDGNKFYNNTFYSTGGELFSVSGTWTSTEFKNNIVVDVGSNLTTSSPAGFDIDSNNWFGATAQGTNALQMDPIFLDAAAGDFHLQSGSPLRDSGIDIAGLLYDFDGVERMAGLYSMGAFERD